MSFAAAVVRAAGEEDPTKAPKKVGLIAEVAGSVGSRTSAGRRGLGNAEDVLVSRVVCGSISNGLCVHAMCDIRGASQLVISWCSWGLFCRIGGELIVCGDVDSDTEEVPMVPLRPFVSFVLTGVVAGGEAPEKSFPAVLLLLLATTEGDTDRDSVGAAAGGAGRRHLYLNPMLIVVGRPVRPRTGLPPLRPPAKNFVK